MPPTLLSLPAELRLSIWELCAPIIQFPRRELSHAHPLALLEVCHSVRAEVLPILHLDHLQIHCDDTEHMLDFLFGLSEEQRAALRHLSIRDKGICLYKVNGRGLGGPVYWHEVMPLFPGIQLDTLTILDEFYRTQDNRRKEEYYLFYWHIENTVRCGLGWKELRVICSDASVLTLEDDTLVSPAIPHPQPTAWISTLRERDGIDSGTNVQIFIATKEYDGKEDVIYHTSKREVFDSSKILAEVRRARDGIAQATSREVMIIMRRGAQAAYVEDGSGSLKGRVSRIKESFEGRSWKDIKEQAAEQNRSLALLPIPWSDFTYQCLILH